MREKMRTAGRNLLPAVRYFGLFCRSAVAAPKRDSAGCGGEAGACAPLGSGTPPACGRRRGYLSLVSSREPDVVEVEKEVFQPLKDIHVFLDTCTVLNDTLAWDINGNRDNTTCLDIDPDMLYELPAVEEKIA